MLQQLNIKLNEDEVHMLDMLRKQTKPIRTRTAMAREIVRDTLINAAPKRGRRADR